MAVDLYHEHKRERERQIFSKTKKI